MLLKLFSMVTILGCLYTTTAYAQATSANTVLQFTLDSEASTPMSGDVFGSMLQLNVKDGGRLRLECASFDPFRSVLALSIEQFGGSQVVVKRFTTLAVCKRHLAYLKSSIAGNPKILIELDATGHVFGQ